MLTGLEELRAIADDGRWGEVVREFMASRYDLPGTGGDFATFWIERGHRIREQVADDRALIEFLRAVLPPYVGGPLLLYRGESRPRMLAANVGLSWTRNVDVAKLFACGLNNVGGGVVLMATVSPETILMGPNAHSNYLGEDQFTVDPANVAFEVVEEFPPWSSKGAA